MRGIDSVVKSSEHLLLQECFNEELSWLEPDLCFFTRSCVDTLIITIPFTQLEQMTAVTLYICASVSDLICVWSGCCIFMWLCGHLVWQAVCFKIGWSPKERGCLAACCLSDSISPISVLTHMVFTVSRTFLLSYQINIRILLEDL